MINTSLWTENTIAFSSQSYVVPMYFGCTYELCNFIKSQLAFLVLSCLPCLTLFMCQTKENSTMILGKVAEKMLDFFFKEEHLKISQIFQEEIGPEWLIALVIWFTGSSSYFTGVLTRAKSDHSGQKKTPDFHIAVTGTSPWSCKVNNHGEST